MTLLYPLPTFLPRIDSHTMKACMPLYGFWDFLPPLVPDRLYDFLGPSPQMMGLFFPHADSAEASSYISPNFSPPFEIVFCVAPF